MNLDGRRKRRRFNNADEVLILFVITMFALLGITCVVNWMHANPVPKRNFSPDVQRQIYGDCQRAERLAGREGK